MISHQNLAPLPLITQLPHPSPPQIPRTAFCLNPAKTVSFPHNLTSPDLPGSVWITSPQLPAQATRAQNVFECSVTNAGESHPPSKDLPSAAEPPRSAEPDSRAFGKVSSAILISRSSTNSSQSVAQKFLTGVGAFFCVGSSIIAQTDLFHSALGKEKQVASPLQLPEAKKACTEPSVFVGGSSIQRAPFVPYDDDLPAGDDQRMDKHPDFKASLPIAGLSSPAMAKARLPKPAAAKAGPSRSTTTKANSVKPAITPIVADDPVVVATLIAFPVNMPWGSKVGMIEVLKSRIYIIPSFLSQEPVPVMHQDSHDKKFFITQVQAAQVAMGAPVASDSGSNDDDVQTSK
ncbi:hypothetical protein E4T56_gene18511 [Termitomyces sp. T112]|nr:hypothetical protein E4T56_gene18511 [Termitomyces sp. T112]